MKQFQCTITDSIGIHARPAGLLVKTTKGLDSTIAIAKAQEQMAALYEKALTEVGEDNACAYIEPNSELLSYLEEKRQNDLKLAALLQNLKKKPNVTLDGTEINVCANIGNESDEGLVRQNDAGGIGRWSSG